MQISRLLAAGMLGAALVLTGCSAAPSGSAASASAPATQGENLDAQAFAALIKDPAVVVIDVRTPEEFAAGHLENATSINVEGADFADKIARLDKSATYALYCRSGNRSNVALQAMKQAGFTKVHHLVGGIGAWQAAGGAVVQ